MRSQFIAHIDCHISMIMMKASNQNLYRIFVLYEKTEMMMCSNNIALARVGEN